MSMSIARASVFDISRVLTENGLCAVVVDKLAGKTLLPARNLTRNIMLTHFHNRKFH